MLLIYVHTLDDSTLDNLYWELLEEFILNPKAPDISNKIDDIDTLKLEEFSRYRGHTLEPPKTARFQFGPFRKKFYNKLIMKVL